MFGKFEHEYESWQIEFRIAQGHTYLKYINVEHISSDFKVFYGFNQERPVQDTFEKYLDTNTFSKKYLDTDTLRYSQKKVSRYRCI